MSEQQGGVEQGGKSWHEKALEQNLEDHDRQYLANLNEIESDVLERGGKGLITISTMEALRKVIDEEKNKILDRVKSK